MTDQAPRPISFTQPIRQITSMLLACGLIGFGLWMLRAEIAGIINANPFLDAFIIGVLALGVLTCFWQVLILIQSVRWIENFANEAPGADDAVPPQLLAPLAALLRGQRRQITSSNANSILDSVATRIDEARDVTRYLTNLLIFLGLLGTFYGLATTIPAIVGTIKNLAPQEGETGVAIFGKLMAGLQEQLGGMSTAFSSSLMGLAGSLIVGLLELFASHGQNRFYRELEDWLSTITRLGFVGDGETQGQELVPQLLDHMAGQVEVLQTLFVQAEEGRQATDQRLEDLSLAIATMGADPRQLETLNRIAEGQERLLTALAALAPPEGGPAYSDAESRMRLRSIDVQLLRILEELSAGRQEAVQDLRAELSVMTNALRGLSRGPGIR
ncbi:biopolymer transporter ExbB [Rhodobacter sp. KR11]|uniref:biopolymer transporter ExbB n=1 Tax=Rhodobacter sp. KR11 TaxID=2974588 RepID=UPI002221488E|nr:biopolymer transporter ExbB [Rhodobacter sp. KR11]MCW1919670.1 biopolymer transporter ExbB [Rhodobacter sp. KR11]